MKKLNLIGQRYSKLTVIEAGEKVGGRTTWKCQCECGTIKIIKTDNLRDGSTKSCGCWNDEQRSKRAKNMYSVNIKYTPSIASARKVWKRNKYNDGDITFEQFYELSQKECHYCGGIPSNLSNNAKIDKKSSEHAKLNGDFIYNGLDRIDSYRPHMLDNVVPCCKYCNYAKRERTTIEFYNWIERVYNKKNGAK